MRRRRGSKRRAQQSHARRRARERLGIDLKPHVEADIIRRIQNGEAKLARRQSLRVSVYYLEVEGQELAVVYDRQRKCVVTLFDAEWERQNTFTDRDQERRCDP